jgi:methionyl-tRNA formyltransferase
MTSGRIAFMGSPEFAVASLQALVQAGADVRLVVTQPDKPAGRGNQLKPPAVKAFALEAGLTVLQPTKVRDGTLAQRLRDEHLDLLVVAAYGRILGRDVLDAPRQGCVNVHASLLPRWRGASPIARAIAAGDAQTGVCLMRMEEGLDTGPVLDRVVVPIAQDDTTRTLEVKLAEAGAHLLAGRLADLLAGRLPEVPQPTEGVTLAPPLDDWTQPAHRLHAHVRAMQPWPCATTLVPQPHEIWKVFAEGLQVGEHHGLPGTIACLDGDAIWVHAGEGSLRIERLQRPDKRQMAAAEVLRGVRLGPGSPIG